MSSRRVFKVIVRVDMIRCTQGCSCSVLPVVGLLVGEPWSRVGNSGPVPTTAIEQLFGIAR